MLAQLNPFFLQGWKRVLLQKLQHKLIVGHQMQKLILCFKIVIQPEVNLSLITIFS